MKRADISIQYIFLIFIGVIAVFVIVGMLTKWAFSADKFVCVLSGDCNVGSDISDKQTIWVRDVANPQRFTNEVAKHAKLCFEKIRKNRESSGELCYTVQCCEDDNCNNYCTSTCASIMPIIESSLGENTIICNEFRYKATIEYDFGEDKVWIH